jgi:hypothetical protein
MGLIHDLNHLHEHSRAVALLPAEERIAWIRRERWIEYSRGVRALPLLAGRSWIVYNAPLPKAWSSCRPLLSGMQSISTDFGLEPNTPDCPLLTM